MVRLSEKLENAPPSKAGGCGPFFTSISSCTRRYFTIGDLILLFTVLADTLSPLQFVLILNLTYLRLNIIERPAASNRRPLTFDKPVSPLRFSNNYSPFKPDNVTPRIKKSCASRKTTMTGMMLMTVPAISTGQSVEYMPCMEARPSGKVILFCELM